MENTFSSIGVHADLVTELARLKIEVPTPIQAAAIPLALSGADLIGIAQTGTGKTLAFGLPLIQRLKATGGKALILLPTRELAEQVEASLLAVGRRFGLTTVLVMGGASMQRQIQGLRRNPTIIIATPGRLVDHLQKRTVNLSQISVLVLDEADRMLDMGFAPQVNQILQTVPATRQTLLFSATMPDGIKQLASKYLRNPQTVAVAVQGMTVDRVEQHLHVVHGPAKVTLLQKILSESIGSVLVFTRTKHGAKKLTKTLTQGNISATEIHGNRSQGQRRQALDGFKRGRYRVLVATDVAARGIDVNDIELVVNYDLPEQAADYVHRIGRTARAGKAGKAISFATPDQHRDVKDIERSIKLEIPRTEHAAFDLNAVSATRMQRGRGSSRPFQPRQGSGGRTNSWNNQTRPSARRSFQAAAPRAYTSNQPQRTQSTNQPRRTQAAPARTPTPGAYHDLEFNTFRS